MKNSMPDIMNFNELSRAAMMAYFFMWVANNLLYESEKMIYTRGRKIYMMDFD